MEYDNEALDAKRTELRGLVQQAVPPSIQNPHNIAEAVLNSFIQLTAPTQPERVIEMITMQPFGSGGGRSRKPGNIYLNWRKLMDLAPDVTIAGVGGATSPRWLLPFIGLYVWNKLWCSSEEQLSETEATIMYTIWKHRNSEDRIAEEEGYERTNATRKEGNLPALTRKEFDVALNRLLEMECIEIEAGIIWLREWVRVRY